MLRAAFVKNCLRWDLGRFGRMFPDSCTYNSEEETTKLKEEEVSKRFGKPWGFKGRVTKPMNVYH
jgi:hypothetical protein